MHLLTAPAAVADVLTAAGIRATVDPRNVRPPCVWVAFTGATRRTTCTVAASVAATVMAPGPANLDALKAIDALAGQVQEALNAAGLPWSATELVDVESPATGDTLLGLTYRITTPTEA